MHYFLSNVKNLLQWMFKKKKKLTQYLAKTALLLKSENIVFVKYGSVTVLHFNVILKFF